MHWFEQWRALAARIEGLVRAAEVFGQFSHGGRHDVMRVIGKSLLPEASAVDAEVRRFQDTFSSVLPEQALAATQAFLASNWLGGLNMGEVAAIAPVVILRSRFEYAVRDTEVVAKSRVELAFEHLRRLIAVDPDCRSRWDTAFREGEPRCEKLGAVHLLAQGLWAFKVAGSGAATDLVMNEPVQDEIPLIERTGHAIVLTEWKVVRELGELERKATEARAQASLYAGGLLGGLELKRTRYAVLVTATELGGLSDVEQNGIVYRHIVVPVNPDSPSKAARKGTERAKRG